MSWCPDNSFEVAREHDDVIKWKHFPRYWPVVRGIHRSPVNSPHKGQWRGPLMFSLICVWINGWVNNREAGDLRRYRAHYDVTVVKIVRALQRECGFSSAMWTNYQGSMAYFDLITHLLLYEQKHLVQMCWLKVQNSNSSENPTINWWAPEDGAEVLEWISYFTLHL